MTPGKPTPPAPPNCGLCGEPADVERHGAILRRCVSCVRKAMEAADLQPCICCGAVLTEHNANLHLDGRKTGVWQYCANCFESFSHRLADDADGNVAAIKAEGYYRISRPRKGQRCPVLDPRELAVELEPQVRADFEATVAELEAAIKSPKIERKEREAIGVRLARAKAILASPASVKRFALARAKRIKNDEVIKGCRSKLALVVRSLSNQPDFDLNAALRAGRLVLEAETNSNTGYVGFKLHGEVR